MASSLHRVPLLEALPADKLAVLEAAAQRRSFKRGEIVFHKGDDGTSLFLIIAGQVRILLLSDAGEEALLGVLDSGDFFGELALIDQQPRSATIVGSEPTETLILHRDDFLALLRGTPELVLDMLRILSRRLREANNFIEDAVFLDIPGRLAKKLLELADTYGRPDPAGTVIGVRLTQQELATMVGARRESVNKHLQSYRAHGILDLERQQIVIRKPLELRRRIR